MNKQPLYQLFQIVFIFLMFTGVVITCFPNLFPFAKSINAYAAPIMLAYLFSSILLLAFRQQRLMFIALGCCAMLCLYLKRLDTPLVFINSPKNKAEAVQVFSLAHFNLSVGDDLEAFLQGIRTANADIISIQEIRFDLVDAIKDSLETQYLHQYTIMDARMFGMGVFSKFPLLWFNNMRFDDLANPICCLTIEPSQEKVCLASTNTFPALSTTSAKQFSTHLEKLSVFAHEQDAPTLITGDFNAVPWSNEIKIFEQESGLKGSRSGFMGAINTEDFFNLPMNHIFYSPDLYCHRFENLTTSNAIYTGVMGTYSIKSKNEGTKESTE